MKRIYSHTCPGCQRTFESENKKAKYCSPQCYHNARRKKPSKGFEIVLLNPDQDTYNQRLIRLTLHSESLPKIDTSDPEQVQKRVMEYLNFCVEHDHSPSIVHVANWIGIHRSTLNDWKNGTPQRKEHQKIIQQFYAICEELLIDRVMNNRISPCAAIFLLKNWFGWRDKVDLSLERNTEPFAELPEEEQKKRILDDIPIDDEIDGDGYKPIVQNGKDGRLKTNQTAPPECA